MHAVYGNKANCSYHRLVTLEMLSCVQLTWLNWYSLVISLVICYGQQRLRTNSDYNQPAQVAQFSPLCLQSLAFVAMSERAQIGSVARLDQLPVHGSYYPDKTGLASLP